MVSTLILAMVCIILIFILYLVTGGWRKYGGLFGIFKWMQVGMRTQGSNNVSRTLQNDMKRPVRTSQGFRPSDDPDVVAILRDLYVEFDDRLSHLESRIAHLEQRYGDTTGQIQVASEADLNSNTHSSAQWFDPTASRSSLSAVVEPMPSGNHQIEDDAERYFAILDCIDSGATDEDIVAKLGVNRDEVLYVRAIMQSPFEQIGHVRR